MSHITPSFVFKWLREKSDTGHIRFGMIPNRRAQDAIKQKLLCDGCEQRFAVPEGAFSEQVFLPIQKGLEQPISYGPWMMKFAVSVSWRSLIHLKRTGSVNLVESRHPGAIDRALEAWQCFLLGRSPNPGSFQQHMLPMDIVTHSTGTDTPPNLNQWILRCMEMDVVSNVEAAYVYTKMCRFILFGFIAMPNARQWKGMKLHVNGGTIGGKSHYVLPGRVGRYLNSRAENMHRLQRAISQRQREVIEKNWRDNPERVLSSESMRALSEDLRLFGDAAYCDHE
jgi:hypothetical protein